MALRKKIALPYRTPKSVTVFEVGPRDGLQNEKTIVPTAIKLQWIEKLLQAGVTQIEIGSFVRPDKVPQMADTEELWNRLQPVLKKFPKAQCWFLVPNAKGLERAVATGVKNIAVFTAASETFNQKNIGLSIADSLQGIREICTVARSKKLKVRGYVSTAFGCPFEGKIAPAKTVKVVQRLLDLGITQVSIGDTIGVATPRQVEAVFVSLLQKNPAKALAGHFHDTYGMALANALRALDLGIPTLDSSAGGLGGCPFAPGATGNLATEDLLYLLQGEGLKTGIDLARLQQASSFLKGNASVG